MTFPSAGMPPASIGSYIEDMLNELAELAEKLENAPLAASIRQASLAAARANAQEWVKGRAT